MLGKLTVFAMLSVLACGGGEAAAEISAGPVEPQPDLSDPQVLGELVAASYLSAMEDIVALCEERPPVPELAPQVDALFAGYVDVFVGYGRFYRDMTPEDRAAVDLKLSGAYYGMGQELFNRFSEAVSHYRALDNDLANRISEFNTVTQYYNYELLRAQNPQEAQRLGI